MAHFAQLDENNIVLQVIVISNNEILDDSGVESEQRGIDFCKSLYGENTRWVQTSYNGNFRANYAVVGAQYDPVNDVFILEKPLPSWVLNAATYKWEPPIPYPNDGKEYRWRERDLSWIETPTSN
jgi:hypothetical protein